MTKNKTKNDKPGNALFSLARRDFTGIRDGDIKTIHRHLQKKKKIGGEA